MCGIVALVDSDERVLPEQIDAMRARIVHRGPDAGATHVWQSVPFSVGLGAQRLSIVDLSSAGTMPMANEDQSVWIVYNGEIYNHPELRLRLEHQGHRYRSRTDTETILHAYEEYGLDCFALFNGMFACIIYDERAKRVVIARDRTGVKPLYYSESRGKIAIASELKALVRTGLARREIDPAALEIYLALGYVPAPFSLVRGVKKLSAGTYGIYEGGRLQIEPYWFPSSTSRTYVFNNWAETVEETRSAVTGAVRRQMMGDVAVGVMLSGGLDSTIITALARQSSPEPLHTFSIGFETSRSDLEPMYNFDREHARLVANEIGTVHHEIVATDGPSLEPQLRKLVAQLDEPVWEPSFLSIYLMSALAREHGVKVLLTGDGSDELFGGYPWHSALSRLERIERVPGLHPILALLSRAPLPRPTHAKVRDLARKYRRSDVAKYHAQYDIFDGETRARLLGRSGGTDPLESLVEPLFEANHSTSLTERFALTELTLWVGEHFNQRLDRMAMAASVEGRVPFQDNAVVDLALAIPVADKIRAGHGKAPLRAAFSHCVPAAVMRRAKRPFAAPATAWMHGALRPLISTSLSPESLSRVLEIDPDVASTVLAPLRDGLPVRQERVWSLFHLVLWAEALKQPPVEVPPPFAVAGVPMTSERV